MFSIIKVDFQLYVIIFWDSKNVLIHNYHDKINSGPIFHLFIDVIMYFGIFNYEFLYVI